MFLVKPFSIKELLKEHAIAGVPQLRGKRKREVPYLWIGIAFLDMENLPDPDLLAQEIVENLEAGLESFREIVNSLNGK